MSGGDKTHARNFCGIFVRQRSGIIIQIFVFGK